VPTTSAFTITAAPPAAASAGSDLAAPTTSASPAVTAAAAARTSGSRDDAYQFSARWARELEALQSYHIRAIVYPKRVHITSTDFDGLATYVLAAPLTMFGPRKAFRVRIDKWNGPKSYMYVGLLPADAKPRDKAKISELGGGGISICPTRHMLYEGAWWYNRPAGDALHLQVPEKSEVQVTVDLEYGEATLEVFLPHDLTTPARSLLMTLASPLAGAEAVLPAVSLSCRGDCVDLIDAR
jgi:hypothetical protein